MQDKDMNSLDDHLLNMLLDFFEYVLVFTIIVECNSLFVFSENYRQAPFATVLVLLAIVLVGVLILLNILLCKCRGEIVDNLKSYIIVLSCIYLWSLLFFILNVIHIDGYDQIREYILGFFCFLPLMSILFRINSCMGRPYEMFLKHADLVVCFALINLVIYLTAVFHPEPVLAHVTMSRWSNLGYLRAFHNLLNICNVELEQIREIAGFLIYRNQGIFTEPLMFTIPLITALSTEMFLREKEQRKPWKWGVLLLTVFSTQATLGIMIVSLMCGAKILEVSNREKRKKTVILVIASVTVVFIILFLQKMDVSEDTAVSSLAVHIEDYKLALKAFLKHPILGNGYQNENAVRAFMTTERLERNRGLSNSIALVLAEGGIILGLMCMLPFFICFSTIKSRHYRSIALWGLGPFCLYCLTIFHFHAFLLMLMAFGYGLIEIRVFESKNRFCLSYEATGKNYLKDNLYREMPNTWKKTLAVICVMLVGGIFFSGASWKLLYTVLKSNQLYLGQSAWKPYFSVIYIILIAVMLRFTIQGILWNKERRDKVCLQGSFFLKWKRYTLWFVVYSVLYMFFYPTIYAWVSTLLSDCFHCGDLFESFTLAGILFGGITVGWSVLWCFEGLNKKGKRNRRRTWAWVSLIICVLILFGAQNVNRRIKDDIYLPTSISDVLVQAVKETGGTLYSNELSVLARKSIPTITYSATRDGGFSVYDNVSVLMKHGQNIRELIDSGFEVAELSADYLLYSNDKSMIQYLTEKGYTFYKYFAFEQPVNLRKLASFNRVIYVEGEIRIEGEDSSVQYGPYSELKNGDYTVEYKLHRKREKSPLHDLVCILSIQSYYGKRVVKNREVYADEFDVNGDVTVKLTFTSDDWEGMEYLAVANGDSAFQIKAITIKETPQFIIQKTFNGRKQIIKEVYYTLSGDYYIHPDGYSIVTREYDRVGRIRTQRYFDSENRPIRIHDGYARIDRKYDKMGHIIREEYYDVEENLVSLPKGYAVLEQDFDAEGHVSTIRYYNTENKPVITENGYAEIHRVYGQEGRLQKESFYDDMGNATLLAEGYASCEYEYDDVGNVNVIRYLDVNDQPVTLAQNYAEVHRDYDSNRRIIRESYYGIDGNPVKMPQGYVGIERGYDDANNVILQRYIDVEGKPVMTTWNYAEVHRVFNQKRWVLEERYYNQDGTPIALPQKYWLVQRQYDERGNAIVIKYYDTEKQPVLTTWGYAEIRREYNERNEISKESYYGTDGQLLAIPQGYAYNERKYDDEGNAIIQRYYDANGNPVITTWNYAEVHRVFDEERRVIEESYYGIDGKPMLLPSGQWRDELVYDEKGRVTVQKFFGIDGLPVVLTSGYAEFHRDYNEKGQISRESYYDSNGEPTVLPQGYSVNEREYDEAGNANVQRYLNTNGQLVMTSWGYAEVHRVYNDKRQVISEKYYDTEGKEISK